jgi:GWxTD domain-containing protein
MRPTLALVALILTTTLPCGAQPAPQPEPWHQGPVRVLLTPAELSALEGLSSAAERAAFEDAFWARRDPDPGTVVNEFRIDFEARVRAADRQFGDDDVRGAVSDRGQVLLLLGAPQKGYRQPIASFFDQLYHDTPSGGSHPALGGVGYKLAARDPARGHGVVVADLTRDVAANATFMESSSSDTLRHGVRFDLKLGVAEVWLFARDELPACELPEGLPEMVRMVFFDRFGSGRYELQTDILGSGGSQDLLAAVAAGRVVNRSPE